MGRKMIPAVAETDYLINYVRYYFNAFQIASGGEPLPGGRNIRFTDAVIRSVKKKPQPALENMVEAMEELRRREPESLLLKAIRLSLLGSI